MVGSTPYATVGTSLHRCGGDGIPLAAPSAIIRLRIDLRRRCRDTYTLQGLGPSRPASPRQQLQQRQGTSYTGNRILRAKQLIILRRFDTMALGCGNRHAAVSFPSHTLTVAVDAPGRPVRDRVQLATQNDRIGRSRLRARPILENAVIDGVAQDARGCRPPSVAARVRRGGLRTELVALLGTVTGLLNRRSSRRGIVTLTLPNTPPRGAVSACVPPLSPARAVVDVAL